MKKISLFLAFVMILSLLTGCGTTAEQPAAEPAATEAPVPEETPAPVKEYPDGTFDLMTNLIFDFSTGAGGWNTTFQVNANGYIDGQYHDSEMGMLDAKKYPNGSMYLCSFKGSLSAPEKINDYSWITTVLDLNYVNEPETEEILEGIRYIYSECYGFKKGDTLTIYVPGTPISELPEKVQEWLQYKGFNSQDISELTCYILCNDGEDGYTFTSEEYVHPMQSYIDEIKVKSNAIEESLKNDDLDQMELNEKSKELYTLWDDALNALWTELKTYRTEDVMNVLLDEEIQWVKDKEAAVKQVQSTYSGGSMEAMAGYMKAAELTEARVYELLQLVLNR